MLIFVQCFQGVLPLGVSISPLISSIYSDEVCLLCGVSNKKREERNHFNINITNRLNAANERH